MCRQPIEKIIITCQENSATLRHHFLGAKAQTASKEDEEELPKEHLIKSTTTRGRLPEHPFDIGNGPKHLGAVLYKKLVIMRSKMQYQKILFNKSVNDQLGAFLIVDKGAVRNPIKKPSKKGEEE